MLRLSCWVCLLFSPVLAIGADNTVTPAEAKSGWVSLFDGKTTTGWRNFKKDKISDGWKVVDGALTRADKGAGDIITADQYDNFELLIEYKIAPEGNSGIMFRVTEEDSSPWKTGPEIQVQDNVKPHDPQLAGWLYGLYQPKADFFTKQVPDATRPPGEWNQLYIRITDQQSEIQMNGIIYEKFQIGSPDWDERVAKSKFAKAPGFGKAKKGHICLQDHGDLVAYRNIKLRPLNANGMPPEVAEDALPVTVEKAFPALEWANWKSETDDGKNIPFRPIVLTHAGDGSNRVFVASQQGVIYVFDNDQGVKTSQVFLDISDRVAYSDSMNEEGLLGMAFHPKFKENGEVIVSYSSKKVEHLSVVSKFTVSKDDKNKADPASEQEILTLQQPYWNHNGGTVGFGKDGYLYVAFGDGGAGNDPHGNGQNLGVMLGKIVRIDVDHKDAGKNYAVPKDNPFCGKEGALPEIYSYGWRNPWRMAFDSKTGDLWCADVGQAMYEEINIVTCGGNYGWSRREGSHPFGKNGVDANPDMIEPIYEYDHNVGKSITGGTVYRGSRVPELAGKYIYADYVSGKVWALTYDPAKKEPAHNATIAGNGLPILSFGEDEQGDVYFMVVAADGHGIYRFAKK